MFKPLPTTLQHGALRLEPLVEADTPELVSLTEANHEVLQYVDGPTRPDWYRQGLTEWCEGRALPLVVHLGAQLVETTRFTEFLPVLPACEIDWTWLDRAQHGSGLNRMTKYLMLRHAFDNLRMARVQLSVAANNLHTQGAIDKLGAQHEGVLRNHRWLAGRRLDDIFVYDITDHGWPQVKAALEASFTG